MKKMGGADQRKRAFSEKKSPDARHGEIKYRGTVKELQ